VLTPQERHFYDLEAFWRHGEQHRFIPAAHPSPVVSPLPAP
jgi:hypothetical protein